MDENFLLWGNVLGFFSNKNFIFAKIILCNTVKLGVKAGQVQVSYLFGAMMWFNISEKLSLMF